MADRVGQQLGNYQLLRVLGRGAFAEVYLGKHQYLEILAAIKILHVQMEPEMQASFQREARTIAHLQHPHIVRVLEFGIESQTPYLVIEYAPNGTLRMQHPKGTRLPLEQIVTYVKQLAPALDYAHQQGLIHRDVKPENMLLNAQHEVVLSDFGIAVVQRTMESLSTQQPAGTPLYIAPEQIRGKPRPASDQYSLAVVVYEWLCGEPPFRGSLLEVYGQHLHQPPPGLSTRVPHLPPEVEQVIMTSLAKDPQQRFANMQAFAHTLEQASKAKVSLSVPFPFVTPSSPATLASRSTKPAPPIQTSPGTSAPAPSPTGTNRPLLSRFKASALLYLIATASLGLLADLVLNALGKLPPLVIDIASGVNALLGVFALIWGAVIEKSFPKGIWRNANRPFAVLASIVTVGLFFVPLVLISPPIPPPSVAGRVLYETHDFRGWTGTSDWKVLSNTNTLVNDATHDHSQPPYGPSIPAPYLVQGTNDYAVEARIQVTRATPLFYHPCFGITVRGNPVGGSWQGYYVGVGCNSYLTSVFISDVNTLDSYLKEAQFAPGTTWHTYRVEVKATTIRFLVDGGLILELQDNTYLTGGQVGLFCYSVQLSVSDFKVIGL